MAGVELVEDPDGALGHGLPLDREVQLALVAQVLAWNPAAAPPADDIDLAALELTGHARVIRDEVAAQAAGLLGGPELGELLGYALAEAGRRLSVTSSGSASSPTHRAEPASSTASTDPWAASNSSRGHSCPHTPDAAPYRLFAA
ncbi:restriction endonuclease [Streptomyces sp. NPDC058401]|uniref:restriction endonuclease n=1 Tax=Streptomyces sp. NPDC058401 TaxID=3346480 RepID=UPI003648AD9B